MSNDPEARGTTRADWPVRISRLGEELHDDGTSSPEQRLAMMWELVTQAWAVARRELPDYDRKNTPVCLVRRGSPEDS